VAKKYIEGFSVNKAKKILVVVPYVLYLKIVLKSQQEGFSLQRLMESLLVKYLEGDADGDMQDKRDSAL